MPADASFPCDKDAMLGAVIKERHHVCHSTRHSVQEEWTLQTNICIAGAECFLGILHRSTSSNKGLMQCVVNKGHLAKLQRAQLRLAPGVNVALLQLDVERFEELKFLRLLHPSSSITTWLG
jgi:hypothetical protein